MAQEEEARRGTVAFSIGRRGMLQTTGAGLVAAVLGMGTASSALAQYGMAGGKEFHGAYPYELPPVGHYNNFVPHNMAVGIYRDLMEMPLAMYYWASGKWMSLLATSWNVNADTNTLQVSLRQGVKWSDGKVFNANDVINTFTIRRLLNNVEWKYLDRIDKLDDYTLNFVMANPTTTIERYVLRTQMVSSTTYGGWAEKVNALIASGATNDSEEWKKLRQDFTDFKPASLITTGPFTIDPKSITDSQLTLKKVSSSWVADKVLFDSIVLYNGETPTVTPIVLSREIDYATHGFPPATEKAFKEMGYRILRPPTYGGSGLYFNFAKVPAIGPKQVRQAMAYVIKRDVGAAVALGDSASPVQKMVGFSDRLTSQWLTPDTLSALNSYNYDPSTAESLMTSVDYKRGPDNVWMTPSGDRMEFELMVPAEYADASAMAQAVAENLTAFGIKTAVSPVTFTQMTPNVNDGRFQLAIVGWGSANPHPSFSFVQNMMTYNPPIAPGPGMGFPLKQQVDSLGGTVDLEKMTVESAQGLDLAKQKDLINQLALAYNEILPNIPVYERLGNNPVPYPDIRVKGWPPNGDPIYENSPYADSFVIMMLLDGTLKPV